MAHIKKDVIHVSVVLEVVLIAMAASQLILKHGTIDADGVGE